MFRSLLIVDDSEADRYIIERVVRKSGLFEKTFFAEDGQLAYEFFKNEDENREKLKSFFPPSAVILDINMPRMDGFEFLKKYEELPISKKKETLFVVMLTSSQNEKDKSKARDFPHIHHFFAKPFTLEQLQMIQEKLIEMKVS